MSIKLKRHDKVRLTLLNSIVYIGKIVNISENRIEISDIYLEDTKTKINGHLTFYRNEVATAFRVEHDSNSSNSNDNKTNKLLYEMTELTEMSVNHIYLKSREDDQYVSAINKLQNTESVSVVGLGNITNKTLPLSLLLLSTFNQIYIFDMFKLKKTEFINDLKQILESEEITKIIHGGKDLCSYLGATYKICMQNVFDTQIAHSMITKEPKINLSECLAYHFNFPSTVLEIPLEESSKDELWQERPLFVNQKVNASQLVVYLWKLKTYLQNLMLKDLHQATTDEYNKYYKTSPFQLLLKYNNINTENMTVN